MMRLSATAIAAFRFANLRQKLFGKVPLMSSGRRRKRIRPVMGCLWHLVNLHIMQCLRLQGFREAYHSTSLRDGRYRKVTSKQPTGQILCVACCPLWAQHHRQKWSGRLSRRKPDMNDRGGTRRSELPPLPLRQLQPASGQESQKVLSPRYFRTSFKAAQRQTSVLEMSRTPENTGLALAQANSSWLR